MKKYTLILLVFMFMGSVVQAQDYYGSAYSGKKVSLGITFSPNLHWLRYDSGVEVKKEAKVGYTYGLLSDFALSENYYLSTGFLINNLKASSDFSQGDVIGEIPLRTFHLQYIEIPFGLKLQSTQRYYRSYYGQFGFSAGMKINGEVEEKGFGKTSLGSKAEPFRLGLQVGGGINWQLDHKMNMMTGLSLNNGFTGILNDGKPKSSYVAFNFAVFF